MTQRFLGYESDISLTVPGSAIANNAYGVTTQVDLSNGDFLNHYPPAGLFSVQATFDTDESGLGAGSDAVSVYLVNGGKSDGSAMPQNITTSASHAVTIADIKTLPQIGEIPFVEGVSRYGVFPVPGGMWQTSSNNTWSYGLGASGPGLLSRFVSLLFLNKTDMTVVINSATFTPVLERDRIALN